MTVVLSIHTKVLPEDDTIIAETCNRKGDN